MFTVDSLRSILGELPARAAFASKSPMVKRLNLNVDTLHDDELLRLMADEPRFIRRPIVVIGGYTIPGARKSSLADFLDL